MTDDDLPTADDVRGILKPNIAERMRKHAEDDHARLCQGREYYCECGYDEKTGQILFEGAGEVERLRAALKWVSEQRWNENADLDDICTRAERAALDEQVAQ